MSTHVCVIAVFLVLLYPLSKILPEDVYVAVFGIVGVFYLIPLRVALITNSERDVTYTGIDSSKGNEDGRQ